MKPIINLGQATLEMCQTHSLVTLPPTTEGEIYHVHLVHGGEVRFKAKGETLFDALAELEVVIWKAEAQ